VKVRKSETFLIVSSSHLGISPDILKVYGNVAKEFGAKVFHIGEVENTEEKKGLKKSADTISEIREKILQLAYNARETTREKLEDSLDAAIDAADALKDSITRRMLSLKRTFGSITFVAPTETEFDIPEEFAAEYDEFVLSKYLMLSAIQPVSDVSTMRPVNRNAVQALKQYGSLYSWIVPHPIPAVVPFPRPGLNNTHNYYTVGSMKKIEQPTKRQNNYEASHSPAAMLVMVDSDNDEFHAVHLHIDFVDRKGYRASRPIILYDGLCFTVDGVKEVDTKDRAVFITDEHEPFHHAGVLGATRALNQLFQPYTFINGGDASDCTPVSRHELEKPGTMEGLRISTMISGLKKLLAAQAECESIKERILIDSNHADWLTQFVDIYPQLKGLIDWETVAKEHFPEWTVRLRQPDANSMPYKFGDYSIRHGDQESFQKAELIFENGKYLCGHWHRHQAVRRMVSVGCGCGLNPPYMKHKITDWQNQVTTMTRISGVTAIAPKIVLHDKARNFSRFVYRNQVYEIVRYYTDRKK
jgi:hypothetical protein